MGAGVQGCSKGEHVKLVVGSSGARAPQERAEASAEASATASESNEDVTAMI